MNNRRTAPKVREHLNEEATKGRRRQNVHQESAKQRSAAVRARRLATGLSGAAQGQAAAEAAALASLGPDVLAKRTRDLVAALQRWIEAPPVEWLRLLQQLVVLLMTEVYQVVQEAVARGVVPCLTAVLQLPDSQLPPGAARSAAYALELIASDSLQAAQATQPAIPVLAVRLAAVVAALGPGSGDGGDGGGAAADREAALLDAAHLVAALGAIAEKRNGLQIAVVQEMGAGASLLQLLLRTLEAAAAAAAERQRLGPDPLEVHCCCTALWALGMMIRDQYELPLALQVASHPGLQAALRRVLTAAAPPPELLRGVAWVLVFASGCGAAARAALVEAGGMLPGLLGSAVRLTHAATALRSEDPAALPGYATAASAPEHLHLALLPLLLALGSIAADPDHTLLVLAELQAARPLQQPGGGAAATGMQMLLACLRGAVGHRRVPANAASLAEGLAAGACDAGPVAVDVVRRALHDAGVTDQLVTLLHDGPLDVRREAGAALSRLVEGAAAAEGGGTHGEVGNGPRPGRLAMLRFLGLGSGGGGQQVDSRQVLKSFLELVRSPDADAAQSGLRFVAVVLREVRAARRWVEELDGIDALEAVQEGRSGLGVPALQHEAQVLVDRYWGIDAEEEIGEEEEQEEGM